MQMHLTEQFTKLWLVSQLESRQHIVLLLKRVLRSAAMAEWLSIMSNCQVVNSRATL